MLRDMLSSVFILSILSKSCRERGSIDQVQLP